MHEALQADAKAAFEDWYKEQDMHDGRRGWLLVARAGLASRTHAWKASLRPASHAVGRGAFFLVLDAACPSIGTAARTWVVPLQAGSGQECLARRFPDHDLQTLSGTFTLDGKRLSASVLSLELRTRVVRLRSYALPGGMPAPDFTAMSKDDLMAEAKSLGVHTRKEITKADGTKHRTWRPTADVAADCAAAWERRHQHPDTVQCARNQTAPSARPMATTDLEIQSQLPSDLAMLNMHELRKVCHARGIATKSPQKSEGGKRHVRLSKEQLLKSLPASIAMQPKSGSHAADS